LQHTYHPVVTPVVSSLHFGDGISVVSMYFLVTSLQHEYAKLCRVSNKDKGDITAGENKMYNFSAGKRSLTYLQFSISILIT
jgi:hypothetical protein